MKRKHCGRIRSSAPTREAGAGDVVVRGSTRELMLWIHVMKGPTGGKGDAPREIKPAMTVADRMEWRVKGVKRRGSTNEASSQCVW